MASSFHVIRAAWDTDTRQGLDRASFLPPQQSLIHTY
jgi:hypothetical protein